jgi:hypothetical protein
MQHLSGKTVKALHMQMTYRVLNHTNRLGDILNRQFMLWMDIAADLAVSHRRQSRLLHRQ